jgi:3-hydroxyisobutyrate dehydrogenase
MAGHLLDAGHELRVHTRTRATASGLEGRGAVWCDTPAQVADGAEAVATMVGFPSDVRAVVLGPSGALAAMNPDTLFVDFTTSEPTLAVEIATAATAADIHALDAPVSGGDVGARNASLSIMVGGSVDAFERGRPILELLGSTVVHQGPAGSGQHTKMVNQILIAGTMMGLCEALLYARATDLDAETVLRSVGGGAAASWSLANLAPRILDGDLDSGFYVEHFVKDLGIALDEATLRGLDLPSLDLASRLYASLSDHGGARRATQALIVELADRSDRAWP